MMLNRTLLSHYRRHPVQALFLLTGIVVASALLTGTLLINAQARASYDQGEQYLSATPAGQLRHRNNGRSIDERDYILLRRQGFDMLAPLLRQTVRRRSGESMELLGIDVFAMPGTARSAGFSLREETADISFIRFAYAPHQVWVAPARLEQLGSDTGDRIQLASGERLPPLLAVPGRQLGHRMLMDIGALQQWTGKKGEISSILVFPASDGHMAQLLQGLPDHMEFVSYSQAPDPAELTSSFHLNLAAMGLLAFVVGIFLTYNALAFCYTDRRELIRRLKLAGVTRRELTLALVSELALFLIAGSLAGAWLGAKMSSWLLPGVGRTLAQLYGVYIAYPDRLVSSGTWLPVLMTVTAAFLCVIFPLRGILNAPMLERRQGGWQQHTVMRRDRLMAWTGLLLLAAAGVLGLTASALWFALAGMACLLLGVALLLPAALRILIGSLERLIPPQRARLSWLLADSRWLLGPASLALMAMTLVLVANSGLNTMISSFRDATGQWLDQRLAADLYLSGEHNINALKNWVSIEAPDLTVAERYRAGVMRSNATGQPAAIEVVSLQEGVRFHDGIELIRAARDAKARFAAGRGIYISERTWRIDGWQAGDLLHLCESRPAIPVLGIYHDYGNPKSQWMVSRQLYRSCWPEQAATGLSIYGPQGTDWNHVRAAISEEFSLPDGVIMDQGDLKRSGLALFDRTFTVTRALNSLTLLVAGIGIFCAISAIHHHRVGQQALLSALGLSRRDRGILLLLQWGVLGLLCMVLVWPFGTLLATYLARVITPVAFGWSFALNPELHHYLILAAIAAGSMTLAVVLPTLGLIRVSPAALLREQAV